MRAYKCDRCGKFFEGVPHYKYRFVSEGVYFEVGVVNKEYDLCWKCFTDLVLAGVSKFPLEDEAVEVEERGAEKESK